MLKRVYLSHFNLNLKHIGQPGRRVTTNYNIKTNALAHPYLKMSTFNLPNSEVAVRLTGDLTRDEVLGFPAFKNWIATVRENLERQKSDPKHEFHDDPYQLKEVKIQAVDRFAGGKIGFLKLTSTIENASGSLPGAVFLRGPSVAMMVLLQPSDLPPESQDEKHVLLTVQPRIAAGGLAFTELPAGMVDDGTFKGAAAREIKEELDLTIGEEELVDLTALALHGRAKREKAPDAVFPSAGGCDEYIPIFLCEKRVPRETLKEWTGKLTGLRDKGEKITLKLVKVEDLWWEGARDAKALAACALWEGLKRGGKL